MARLSRSLVEQLAAVACELSADQADALALELEELPQPSTIRHVAGLQAPPAVIDLCTVWKQDASVPGLALADALRTSARAVKITSSYEKVEALVTGPHRGEMRRSEQGLLEVIRGARIRLWVVSYVLSGGGVDPILLALQERAEAGVEVKVLLDHRTDRADWSFARLALLAPACRVYVWPDQFREVGEKYANLHAKCAVADGREALVSSANLTEWAMGENLEVGYLVTGGATPAALDTYFQELEAKAEIVERAT
tara:strand:- start:1667 stop:2431 length:765 start_codon:yes stop_codon:yes gene_type:complete